MNKQSAIIVKQNNPMGPLVAQISTQPDDFSCNEDL
jgi:hypothetical protein